ncbi:MULTISPECIES: glucosamine-6-phosphate deaminase [Bacillaceae]|uniref:glucosamine-6-phosphate deaminase n=1 Tax=Bacillaceae TaxID=186817 RepID=UPI001E5951C5|nr:MULTISPECIES: glucosamine-6-phosphate deaminase [Bacillaceae]MCE4050535.1 glucosamine-6-phosphate deaminase [Bacillus sp. Au-Bac7]MCM3030556.1 glucosamine-6-phosphate deaminase [Niallia sp. MER 6]MDL0434520.1 glucosamine-6-phosphate deaminase [Niallia sp. SS-2023]UPO88508.1 glucosamine-6-phosphate deaminase [Niallia sp. Man26]
MKWIEVDNYEKMSAQAADAIIRLVKEKPDAILGLATGGTPAGTYKRLAEDFKQNKTSYENIKTVNLDEYVGLEANSEQSYSYYMDKHLFDHIDIKRENVHLPKAETPPYEQDAAEYEELIDKLGGVDLQILGIGENGHIGFNEPGTSFTSKTSVVELDESTREANARYFENRDDVPTHAISMGISTIMKSRKIILLASGSKKAPILYNLFQTEVTEDIPASILKQHPDVTIIADSEALAILKDKEGSVYR